MDDNIKIRAGAGLQAVLQSTVNFAQAFTELAKNSLQNGATSCNIDIIENEDGAVVKIMDNARGFDHVKDAKTHMSDFEKYFTFGNSYDLNTDGDGPKLGKMGIGGKISNDKLSEPNNSHWQIHTRNIHGKCFVIDYNPPADVEFFDDYRPSIKEVSSVESPITTTTGTEIRILNVNKRFLKTNYKESVKNELLEFFAHLVISYKKNKKILDIVFMGEKLEFSVDLNGDYRGMISRAFTYEIDGTEHWSTFDIALNQFIGRRLRRQRNHSFIKSVELVSEVKISDLHITNKRIIEKTLIRLSKEEGTSIEDASFLGLMNNFIGYVNCVDLSKVLDERGMPAKDLSHHGLRNDHPMTIPFLEEVYYVIMKLTYHISQLSVRKKTRKTMNKNLVAYNVAKLLAGDFSNDMEILTDKKMLGLDKVEKIDGSQKRDDLILEKLIGDTLPPTEGGKTPLQTALSAFASDSLEDEDSSSAEEGDSTEDGEDSVDDGEVRHTITHDGTPPFLERISRFFSPDKHESGVSNGARPTHSTDDIDEDEDDHGHGHGSSHHETDDSDDHSGHGTHDTRRTPGEFVETSDDGQEYTKVDIDTYREMLRTRSELRDRIAELEQMIADGDDSPETLEELERLRRELADLQDILGKIQLFYAIEHMDDQMVISEIREYNDGFIMVINENNIRYRSIESDVMALALHVAEAMIKEIIYIEDEEIDKTRLDTELSMFYQRHFETLKGNDLLSM